MSRPRGPDVFPGAPLGAGAGTGAAPTEQTGTRPAAARAAARGGTQAHGPMGGMPMGAGGQGGDEDIWGLGERRVMPPVIGEVNRRA